MIKLTDRLQLIADLIDDNENVCDIGTDHGYLPIYLFERNPQRKIVMSDVSAPSLEKCRTDCFAMHPEADPGDFDLRLGSGLEVLKKGEVNCIVMAGMGGMLIQELLGKDEGLSRSINRYILQPRRHAGRMRQWLENNGYRITDERLVRESRFIWPIIVAEPLSSLKLDDNVANTANDLKPNDNAANLLSILTSDDKNATSLLDVEPDDNTKSPAVFFPAGTLIEEDRIEYEYPQSLIKFSNPLTIEYLENALRLEIQKLENKRSGRNERPEEIEKQNERIEYLGRLIDKCVKAVME